MKLLAIVMVAVIAGLAAVGTLGASLVVTMFGGAAPQQQSAAATCGPAGTVAPAAGSFAAPGWWNDDEKGGERAQNAASIIATGRALGFSDRGLVVAIATATQESKLVNMAGGDRDSVGLFQQRPSQGWGTIAQIMDPVYSATKFYQGLAGVSGWETLPVTVAAQRVQRSAFPDAYAKWETLATSLVAANGAAGGVAAAVPCTPAVAALAGGGPPAGGWATESCSIKDPSGTGGCVTPRTDAIAKQLLAQGYSLSCWDAHAWNPTSDHPKGKACDVTMGSIGTFAKGADKARGDALYAALQLQADALGVKYLIWYGRFWDARSKREKAYSGGGVYSPTDATGGHYDHVHISVH